MKRRSPFIIALVLSATLIVSGCSVGENQGVNQPTPSPTPVQPTIAPTPSPDVVEPTQAPVNTSEPNEPNVEASSDLIALLPDQEGYKWVYNGFAEYGHEFELDDIREEDGKIFYTAKGHVHDASDGESDMDYSLEVSYEITADSLIQKKAGEMMLDLFDEMTIIQIPLEEGHSWTQTVQGAEGEEIQLEASIEKIEEIDGAKFYTILYEDKKSPYYERRVIREGVGVVDFTRLYITEMGSYEISYSLYEEASGLDK